MKIAIIIGHNEKKQGAVNDSSGVTEYTFNKPLAFMIGTILANAGHTPVVVYRDSTYRKLPSDVNKTGASLAISLHCNAFDDDPNGSEVLYYTKSTKGKALAGSIQAEVVKCLGLKDRGLRPCDYDHIGKAGDKGGYLLKYTNMPCVLVEPFFLDADSSLELAEAKKPELAQAIANGIINYIKG